MAESERYQKSPLERQVERQRFALAVVGRKALDFAQARNFRNWDEFEKFLAEAFPPSKTTLAPVVASAPAASAKLEKEPAAAGQPGRPPTFEEAALESMDANGVDQELLLTFLGGRGSGASGEVTPADVERYLHG